MQLFSICINVHKICKSMKTAETREKENTPFTLQHTMPTGLEWFCIYILAISNSYRKIIRYKC